MLVRNQQTMLLLLLLLEVVRSTNGQVSYVPFFVAPREESQFRVTLDTSYGSNVVCEFSYVTVKPHADTTDTISGVTNDLNMRAGGGAAGSTGRAVYRDPSTIFEKLSGICIRKTLDYWKYELCFESKVIQSHLTDTNSLGVYVTVDGNEQVYTDGSPCEALPNAPGRTSRVEFVCDRTLRFLSIDEVSTCNYKLIVSTPLVCGHPEFKQASAVIESKQVANAQPWFLEVYESEGGQEVICSVTAVSDNADTERSGFTPSIFFKNFKLELYTSDPSLPRPALFPEYHVCRAKGRVTLDLHDKHYQFLHEDSDTRVILRDGQNFQGKIEHILVQTVARD